MFGPFFNPGLVGPQVASPDVIPSNTEPDDFRLPPEPGEIIGFFDWVPLSKDMLDNFGDLLLKQYRMQWKVINAIHRSFDRLAAAIRGVPSSSASRSFWRNFDDQLLSKVAHTPDGAKYGDIWSDASGDAEPYKYKKYAYNSDGFQKKTRDMAQERVDEIEKAETLAGGGARQRAMEEMMKDPKKMEALMKQMQEAKKDPNEASASRHASQMVKGGMDTIGA